MSPNKDVLGNMFSSFLERKSRSPIAQAHYGSQPARPERRSNAVAVPFLLNPATPSLVHPGTPSAAEPNRGEKRKHEKCRASAGASGEIGSLPPRKSKTDKAGSKMSSSAKNRHDLVASGSKQTTKARTPAGRGRVDSSVVPGTRSSGSVEAIAVDSTSVPAPFHCEKCSKAFRQRSQLSRHFSRVHERQKPFSCAHCDKRFASAFDRKRHVEVSDTVWMNTTCAFLS